MIVDLGSTTTINYAGLLGLNLTATGTVTVKGSTVNGTGDGGVFTSAALAVDPSYGALHYHRDAAAVRWVRFEIADAAVSDIEAGRVVVQNAFRPGHGIRFGYSLTADVVADAARSTGGQDWIRINSQSRGLRAGWRALSTAEVAAQWDDLRIYGGQGKDMLVCTDIEAALPGPANIWGVCTALDPPTHGFAGWWQMSIELRERK